MPQSLANVLTHIIFSTKHRRPIIDDEVAPALYEYLGGTCRALDSPAIKIGGYYDHMHILGAISRKIAIMDLLEEIKKRSSKWIKTNSDRYGNFYWQDGYAIFSVNPQQESVVVDYSANQHLHHQDMSFQDECRKLFRRNRIKWDERYVWD